MPPLKLSRYQFARKLVDDDEREFLGEIEPFSFQPFPDNRSHTVQQGDSLYHLAGKFFVGLRRPAGFWWVIGHFQLDPIFDPTEDLAVGRIIIIPSLQILIDEILGADASEI